MISKIFHKNFFLILIIDTLLLIIAMYAALLTRLDFTILPREFARITSILPYIIVCKLICFFYFDLYRGMWRYTSISDLFNIIKASIVSTLIVVSVILFGTRFKGYSRSIFLIDWCFTVLFITGFRLCIRIYFVHFKEKNTDRSAAETFWDLLRKRQPDYKNLLIIGAGDCGEQMYREIRDNPRLKLNVVGYLDDDPQKIGRLLHGIPILGKVIDISLALKKVNADEILIAIPSANSQQMRRIVEICKESNLKYKTVPGMGELINGKVTVNAIREVAYRDLLGREIIKLDESRIGAYLEGKNVLVTGAGGSIGSELCRQICRFKPQKILLFECAESPLNEIELELRHRFGEIINIVPRLADIQNKMQIRKVFEDFSPEIVFHAAAYKHVPILELQPWKAVDNNVIGTKNLVDAAVKFEVSKFVFVSTDKAVRPANVMGASKRLAEMLIHGQNDCNLSATKFMIVRFGNVVGSVGSVVPLFKKQISEGGPVTVTHPEITRFFMTIPEACQLILQAGAMGKGGEIFILDMGTPIKIDDMARDLIRLSGFEPDVDIEIEYIGLRLGEKLYEELITDGEGIIPTSHEKIMVLKGVGCSLPMLNGKIDEMIKIARSQNIKQIKAKFREIVPEYQPDDTDSISN